MMLLENSELLIRIRLERECGSHDGLYCKIQVSLAYSINKLNGSKLDYDQIYSMLVDNTLSIKDEPIHVNDIRRTVNIFHCIDDVITYAHEQLNESFIKKLHDTLMSGMLDDKSINSSKVSKSEIEVNKSLRELLRKYHLIKIHTFEDIEQFYYSFEKINSIADENGCIGKLIVLKECLKNNITACHCESDDWVRFFGIMESDLII